MPAFATLKIFLFVWLYSLCYGDTEVAVNKPNPTPQIIIPEIVVPDKGASDIKEVVDFVLKELEQAAAFPYKEKVQDVIKLEERIPGGTVYNLTLRLAQSHCTTNDPLCDPYSDPQTEEKRQEVAETVYGPFITPITVPLESPLTPGKTIRVVGMIPSYSEQFVVNIQTGSEVDPISAPLSMSVPFAKYDSRIEIRYFDESWKRVQTLNQKFVPGNAIDIEIKCLENSFEIFNKGQHIASYHSQLPYEDADHLSILGMVEISEITGIVKIPPAKPFYLAPASPYILRVQNLPLEPGRKFTITGFIPRNAEKFDVKFDSTPVENVSIPFHLRYIFHTLDPSSDDLNYISWSTYFKGKYVRNSYGGMSWFKRGQPFHMDIYFNPRGLHIKYHGIWYMDFEYRIPHLKTVTHIKIEGDIHVYSFNESTQGQLTCKQPLARVCTTTVWVAEHEQSTNEMWLRNLHCLENENDI